MKNRSMGKYIAYDEIRRTYGIPEDRLDSWLSKGYLKGEGNYVCMDSLESFLHEIGFTEYKIRIRALTSVAGAYRQFISTLPDMLGPELSEVLRQCIEGEDINLIAEKHHVSLSTLQYYIRTASLRMRRYYDDVPGLRHRLAEILMENRRLLVLMKNKKMQVDKDRDLIKERIIGALKLSHGYEGADLELAYEKFMQMLYTSVVELGLSVRCTNAAVKSGINTLFDFIVVNKACGKSGMLTKLQHFGIGSFREVESLLLGLNLIRTDKDGNWLSAADFLVDPDSELYIRYSGARAVAGHRQRIKGNELVADWIGNYMTFMHEKNIKG